MGGRHAAILKERSVVPTEIHPWASLGRGGSNLKLQRCMRAARTAAIQRSLTVQVELGELSKIIQRRDS